jgi:hypothetical protein
MRINKVYFAIGLIIAFGMFFELAAHADEFNEQTTITFSAPIQIPGQVLPAGTYIVQKADPEDDQNLVRIFSADHTVLYATLQTVPVERRDPTGDTTITLAEPENGDPTVLVNWFYPGLLTGHEFVYSKQQEQAMSQDKQETFVGNQSMPGGETAGQ